MTGWTTGDALAELDRRGFSVVRSPDLTLSLGLMFAILECKAKTAFAMCAMAPWDERPQHFAEGMYHTAKMAELCAFWGEVRPS